MIKDINWRPYQTDCFNSIYDSYKNKNIKRQLVVQATGLGKRLQAVNVSTKFQNSLFLAHSEELIEQAVKDMEKFHGFMNVGIIKGNKFEIDKKLVIASPQTLTNRLDRIKPDHFQLIQIDECFPAGTIVDGIPIEQIKKGTAIYSFNHEKNLVELKEVIGIIKKEIPKYLIDFGVFSCTKKHPIYINKIGYCTAHEIYLAYICNTSMCYLYDSIIFNYMYKLRNKIFCNKRKIDLFQKLRENKKNCIKDRSKISLSKLWQNFWMGKLEKRRKKEKNIHCFSFKRFWMLFIEMQKGLFHQYRKEINDFGKQERCFGTNEKEQSNVQSRNQSKNGSKHARKNFSFSWWKRSIYKTTINNTSVDQSTNGIFNSDKEANINRNLSSLSLQSRPSRPRFKTCNRNRWKNPQIKTLEVLRQTQNERFEFIGLDCSKIHKRRGRSKSRSSSNDNFVYNLEVKDNNNYFVEKILVHNCHRYMAKTWLAAVNHFTPKLSVGWTATPYRLDGLSLSNIFDDIVFEYNIDKGISDGFLCELDGIRIKTEIDISKVHKQAGDFAIGELSGLVDTPLRNQLIVDSYKKYADGRQAAGFCVDIQHCINLKQEFIKQGITCDILVSDETVSPDRSGIDRRFRNKETTVLLNVQILTEGYDYSDIGAVLMIRPTQSLTFYMQAIGRGTRLKSPEFRTRFGLNDCKILDFVDNSGKHNLINTWTLDQGKDAKAKTFVSTEKRDKLFEAEAERARRNAKIIGNVTQDSKINLLKLPKIKTYGGEWTKDYATEKQVDYLKKLGFWQEGIEYTKGMCSELITMAPAASWQIQKLAKWGYDTSGGNITNGQYQMIWQKLTSENKFNPAFKL